MHACAHNDQVCRKKYWKVVHPHGPHSYLQIDEDWDVSTIYTDDLCASVKPYGWDADYCDSENELNSYICEKGKEEQKYLFHDIGCRK